MVLEYCLQDVVRCFCEKNNHVPPLHCDIQRAHLRDEFVGKHIEDEFKDQKLVSLEKRGSISKLYKHPQHPRIQIELNEAGSLF